MSHRRKNPQPPQPPQPPETPQRRLLNRVVREALEHADPEQVIRRMVRRVEGDASESAGGRRAGDSDNSDDPASAEGQANEAGAGDSDISDSSARVADSDVPTGTLLSVGDETFSIENREIHLLGSGKASAAMGLAMERILGDRLTGGRIITPQGTSRPLRRVKLLEGTHPIPDRKSVDATDELLSYAAGIPEGSLVFYLISGGTSALLCRPAGNLSLEDLAETFRALLTSGADIHETNVVRTSLSAVKGGQLLRFLEHVELADLIVSDVPGDRFRSIGSGPTTPGPVEYARAREILRSRGVWENVPGRVREWLERKDPAGSQRKTVQVPPHPGRHRQILVSSARKLAGQVARQLASSGVEATVVEPAYNDAIESVQRVMVEGIKERLETLRGESKRTETRSDDSARQEPGNSVREESKPGETKPDDSTRKEPGREAAFPAGSAGTPQSDSTRTISAGPAHAVIWYGESSVEVTGSGKGGRNQELALRIAIDLEGLCGARTAGDPQGSDRGESDVSVAFASIGTDGVDGPTDAAGAIVDCASTQRSRRAGLEPEAYLENNDAWTFFDRTGELVRTGPTGNNLMDLQIALLSRS